MSAEGLRKSVLDKARAEADEILERAQEEANAALASATELADQAAAETVAKARRDAERARQRALSSLERDMRLKTLEEKNRLLEEAFARAATAFKAEPVQQFRSLYQKELAPLDLTGATVLVPRGAKAEFDALLAGRAAVKEAPAIEAGYIVEHAAFRLDRSLAARLEEIKAELRSEVAGVLFAEQP
jgi:vacuolar-type H+-ATPase subunit E/Vma4